MERIRKAWIRGSLGGTSQIRHHIDAGDSPSGGAQQSIIPGPVGPFWVGVCIRIFPGVKFLKGKKYWGGINTKK